MGTGFSLRPHDPRKFLQSLAARRFLLSFYAPPPPDVPPANIQLMARTRDGSGLFYAALLRAGCHPPTLSSPPTPLYSSPKTSCALHAFGSRVTRVGNVYLPSLCVLCASACTMDSRRGAEDAEGMHMDKSRLCRTKPRHRVVTKICAAQKTTFLQITRWVI